MSRRLLAFALVLSLACGVATAADDSLKEGESIGVFYVTKVAGAVDDGVEPGDDICYRCRYGSQPMVMVFARDTAGKVPELIKQLEAAVLDNEEAKLKGLLTLMGEDMLSLKTDAKEIAEAAEVKMVPIVIAKETKTGPLNYKLSSAAEVTIVLAKDSQVVSTHVFAAKAIDVVDVMRQVKQMLN